MTRSPDDHQALALFAIGASQAYGEHVAAALGVPLAALEERHFEDGEHKLRPLETVRGKDVYVVHSLNGGGGQSVNDKLCRLLFFIATLKDVGAARVTAVAPYLCYSRKDRRTKHRDPVTTRYLAMLFEAVGADRVLTLDVHNLAAFQNAFRCTTEHLEARPLFVEHLAGPLMEGDIIVLAPDEGGMKRAEAFRSALGRHLGRTVSSGFMEKYRSKGQLSGNRLFAEVEGRVVVIVDDLISSGSTLVRTAQAAKKAGARTVLAAATHAVFSPDAPQNLASPALDRLIVTDTVPLTQLARSQIGDKLTVLPTAPLVGEAIHRLHTGNSVSDLLGAED